MVRCSAVLMCRLKGLSIKRYGQMIAGPPQGPDVRCVPTSVRPSSVHNPSSLCRPLAVRPVIKSRKLSNIVSTEVGIADSVAALRFSSGTRVDLFWFQIKMYSNINSLDSKGNYSATSNNTKLVH